MVKNKATAKLCCIFLVWSLSFFLSLSLADLALSRLVLRVSLSLMPFTLRVRLDPAGAGPRHPKTGLQRPLLRPRGGEGQHGVGFGCSCTDSFLGWGSAGSLLLHGLCSGCGEWGALPGCGARPSPCNGFSCHRLQ